MSSAAAVTAEQFDVDTSLFSALDRRFVAVLALTLSAHAAGALWLQWQPAPVEPEAQADELDRFVAVSISPRMHLPHAAAAAAPQPKVAPSATAARPASHGAGARIDPRQTGLLQVLGVDGLTGLLAEDHALVGEALAGARVERLADLGPAQRRGDQAGQRADVGAVGATHGVGEALALEHHDAQLRGRVEDTQIEVDEPELNQQALQQYVAARRSALQSCYERELGRHHALKGKLMVRLSIATNGRARAVEVGDESMGSPEVAACVRTTVERWTFPVKPSSEVPMAFPLVFAPAG